MLSISEVEPETQNLSFKYVSARLTKLVQRVQWNLLRKKSQVKYISSNLSIQWSKTIRSFAWNFSDGHQNVLLRGHKNNWRKLSSKTLQFFHFLLRFWAKSFGRSSKFFRRVVRNPFDVSKKTFWRKFFTLGYRINIHFLHIQRRVIALLSTLSWESSQKYLQRVQKNIWKNFHFENKYFIQFVMMSKHSRSFCQNFFGGVVENAFYVSGRKFRGNGRFNWKKVISIFCPLSEKIWRLSQNVFSKLLKTVIYIYRYFFEEKLWGETKRWEVSSRVVGNHYYQRRCAGRPFDVSVIFWIPIVMPNAGMKIFLEKFVVPK